MTKKLRVLLIVLTAIFLAEVASAFIWANSRKAALTEQLESKIVLKQLKYEKMKKALHDESVKNKYLATGRDVYERIHNRYGQSTINLIEELSKEAFPNDWTCQVKVEEFTHFILLVQTTGNKGDVEIAKLGEHILPVITYGSPYLRNLCVFDKNHKCFLFFDESALHELKTTNALNDKTITDIKSKGEAFTHYNSIKIDFQEVGGHIFVPAIVSGTHGFCECFMMLDTGASMTVISLELSAKTGQEDLTIARRQSFSTAKGQMTCPIVERTIWVDGIQKKRAVAINVIDNTNLLGMDFFEGKNYIIDGSSNCIYVWQK